MKPIWILRWIPCVLVYFYLWFSMLIKLELLRLGLMMTSAFFIFIQHILGSQYVYITEGRQTKVNIRDTDDKGLHYTFPEVKFWLGFVVSLLIFWIPMQRKFYAISACIVIWSILFVFRVVLPFNHIRKMCQKSFMQALIQVIKTANTVFNTTGR
ncbi:Hypothetical_protein [Hexamita inflata]|uniref:Hypothetical_protein n=1 Tax=Hexamita inflata TaxID=28002 RepID=A0AA86QXN8_9EUKA|nr:Hypothetical protein HINF_LOCUS47080 [Hexamita inflata]